MNPTINRAEELFKEAVAAPDLTTFIAALSVADLKELHDHLLHCYDESGISGLIFGAVLVDAAGRLMKGGVK